MRVWSKGLGRVELGFDLTKVKVEFVDNQLVLSGKTEPPVSWDFVIKVDVSEAWLLGMVGIKKPGLNLFSRYLYYKAMKRKMLRERFVDAKKTRTGVSPQVKQSIRPQAKIVAKSSA
jgi:hypothetical protein